MPRRRRHSSSPSDLMMADDDDDLLNQDDFSPQGSDKCPPQQRNAANARERARMRVLSKAFCRLKTTLPWVPADTKLSKLDTLRLASGYIAHLRALLDQPLEDVQQSGRPLNLSWPFTFQQGISTPWISSAISPGRTTSPMPSNHTSRIISADHQSSLHSHHNPQHHHNINNYINNNNSHIMNSENNNCDPGYQNSSYFSRNGYYPQEEGSNMNNYYNQIQRDNYMRHSYSESMISHTG